jgi:two-component system sensor histidine kinase KdpD
VATTLGATLIGWPLYHGFNLPDESRPPIFADTNVLMLYLIAVLWVASRYSRGAAILASVLAVAAFDFCFTHPYLTLVVNDRQYILIFAVMLVTALTISSLTHRVREHAESARRAWERAEAEFLRNTLLSSVSHDLRTPLSLITGAASSLVETEHRLSPDQQAERLGTIYSQAQRMESLVSNLLEMTRLESGGLELRKNWQHLQEVVGSTLRHVTKRLDGRAVTTSIPSDLPLVRIDDAAIQQVLTNLIDNAIKFAPGPTPIELSARASGHEVVVEVADRGSGLPAGAESRIFDKYFRAHGANGGIARGIGLGLAICKGLVEAHGGRITAVNRVGGGAVLSFTLPCGDSLAPSTSALHDLPLPIASTRQNHEREQEKHSDHRG